MFRRACLSLCLFVAAFFGIAALSGPPAVLGQQPKKDKDTKEEVALRAQLKDARADLTKAEKQIAALQAEITQGKALVASLQAQLKKDAKGDATDAKTIQGLNAQLAAIRAAKYVHTSTWKKTADAADSAVTAFIEDVPAILGANKWVRSAWAGKPPATSPDADAVMVLVFEDEEAFKKHKADPQGKRFHDKHDKNFATPKATEFVVPIK
jgi:hypothetical protein